VNEFYTKIRSEAKIAVSELIEAAKLEAGDILVIGCSSSEIVGGHIGKASSPDTANAVFEEIYTVLKEKGIWLAAQCCEHLNRAIIIEKACAERYGYEIVNVKPQPKAGGSFATAAYSSFERPVAVEHIKAHAGMDIGETLIGMHLRDVAVPVRLRTRKIGEANIIAARTRPKFIGGSRAIYPE
jgi:uncharacterized protein (TIGR01440 family)